MSRAMMKYKKLDAKVTGLPWSTGEVHTAKCQICENHNIDMFRRCKDCAYCICSRRECFGSQGFQHHCPGNNAKGPYPTLAEENRILAIHGAKAPPRAPGLSEPKYHTVGLQASFTPTNVSSSFSGLPSMGTSITTSQTTLHPAPITAAFQRVPCLNPPRAFVPRKGNNKKTTIPSKATSSKAPSLYHAPSSSIKEGKKRAHSVSVSEDSTAVGADAEDCLRGETRDGSFKSSKISVDSTPASHQMLQQRAVLETSVPRSSPGPNLPSEVGPPLVVDQPHQLPFKTAILPATSVASDVVQPPLSIEPDGDDLFIDVRQHDFIRIKMNKGLRATNPGLTAGSVQLPTTVFYQYKSGQNRQLHLEPVLTIQSGMGPVEAAMQTEVPNVVPSYAAWRYSNHAMERLIAATALTQLRESPVVFSSLPPQLPPMSSTLHAESQSRADKPIFAIRHLPRDASHLKGDNSAVSPPTPVARNSMAAPAFPASASRKPPAVSRKKKNLVRRSRKNSE